MNNHQILHARTSGAAWNVGCSIGPERALKPQQVWEVRFHLEHMKRTRDRAMFDIAVHSKLRGCDVVKLRIGDVVVGGQVRQTSMMIQQKTGTPVSRSATPPVKALVVACPSRHWSARGVPVPEPD